jgi:hypothetical protein
MKWYLVTPKAELKGFIRAEDRAYFARPVLVELCHSSIATRMVYVRDPARGHSYHCDPHNLRADFRLTWAQRKALEGGDAC